MVAMLNEGQKYDVIIVGAGCSGAFTAFELMRQNKDLKVLVFEKGQAIEKRICPKRITNKCVDCKPYCHITTGFSGAGAYSDGKLSLSPDVGGNLPEYIGYEKTKELNNYVDEIYLGFGADKSVYGLNGMDRIDEIRTKAIRSNLKLVACPIRHLGTEESYNIYSKIQKHLIEMGVEIKFGNPVKDIIIEDGVVVGVEADKLYYAENVVIAIGREGSEWLKDICYKHNIDSVPSTVDIGVRVEVRNEVMKEINENLYEGKFIFRTPTFDDQVRTFCQNPSGIVSVEKYEDGLAVANGHSYKHLKTENTNLAILVSKNFTQPFKDSIGYGKSIARLANMIADDRVIVQRYGDYKRGRRTTSERLYRNNIIPTLKDAVPGDLSLVLPYRIMKSIEEMIEALNGVASGINSEETLLYGVECKFYSNKVKVNHKFETNIKNLYVSGDGASITRGIMQANVNGVCVARNICGVPL
jgi:uncharacterized FAD-dependent dehydrogenase